MDSRSEGQSGLLPHPLSATNFAALLRLACRRSPALRRLDESARTQLSAGRIDVSASRHPHGHRHTTLFKDPSELFNSLAVAGSPILVWD